jgi:hypothetical protein
MVPCLRKLRDECIEGILSFNLAVHERIQGFSYGSGIRDAVAAHHHFIRQKAGGMIVEGGRAFFRLWNTW